MLSGYVNALSLGYATCNQFCKCQGLEIELDKESESWYIEVFIQVPIILTLHFIYL
jgi:hypothetical protein